MILRALSFTSLAFLVGCGGAAIQHAKLAATKTAAIIAFSGEVDLSDPTQNQSGIGGMANAFQGMKDVGSDETETRRAEQAEKSYDILAGRLEQSLGWTVAKRELVVDNAEVKALFTAKMGDRRPNAGIRFGVPGIPWQELGALSVEEQQKLKAALGVEVLVVAKLAFRSGRTWGGTVNGVGKTDVYPKSILTFAVYDGSPEGAIWNERWVESANAEKFVTVTLGVVDTTNETECVVEATGLAVDALMQKFEKSKQEAAAAAAAPTT